MNPLILRYLEAQQKTRAYVVYGALYLFALLIFCIWSIPSTQRVIEVGEIPAFFTTIYALLWLAQMGLFAWAAVQTAREIPREVERKSYDFFRLLPLSPVQKAMGLLVGVNFPVLLLLLVNFALQSVASVFSKIGLLVHAELSLASLCSGVALVCVGLLFSTTGVGQKALAGSRILRLFGVLAFVFTALPMLIGLTFGLSRGSIKDLAETTPFFHAELPLWLILTMIVSYVGAWAYAGCLRRLRYEDAPLVPRLFGAGFLLGVEILLLGLTSNDAAAGGSQSWVGFVMHMMFSSSVLILTYLASRLSVTDYLEERKRRGQPLAQLWPQLSNLTSSVLFLSICVASWAFHGTQATHPHLQSWAMIGLGLLSYGFLVMLFELHTVFEGRPHAGVVVGFALFLWIVFPAIASATLDTQVVVLSSLDFMFYLAATPEAVESPLLLMIVGGVHLAYIGAFAVLLFNQYARIGRLADRLG